MNARKTPERAKRIVRKKNPKTIAVSAASSLYSSASARKSGRGVSVRSVKTIIAFFLLPLAYILTQTFFTSLSRETLDHAFWATPQFWFFSLGAVVWSLTFVGLRRYPAAFDIFLYAYVFGHELTHAVWVWMMGGRVSKFNVSTDGGYIHTDTHNFWIALAPYFYPIYSFVLLAAYAVTALFTDVQPYDRWFFALLGVTWAFHASFTLWMIPKGQSDLTRHGTFFSLTVIYLMNLILLSAMLIIASPHVSFVGFARELFHNAERFSVWLSGEVDHLVAWIESLQNARS